MTDYTIGDLVKESWQNFTDHPAIKYPLRIAAVACIAAELDAVYGMVFGDNLFAHLSGLYDYYHSSVSLLDNAQGYESAVRISALIEAVITIPLGFIGWMYLDEPVMKKLSEYETNLGEKNDSG